MASAATRGQRRIEGVPSLNALRKYLLVISLITMCLIIVKNVQAQELWRGTTYGMSPEEVLKLIPEAKAVGIGGTLQGGVKEQLLVDDVEIVGEHFNAKFYFNNDKLEAIQLELKNRPSFDIALMIFEDLTKALRSKYGTELSRNISKRSYSREANALWQSGKTSISVLLYAIGDTTILNINYNTSLSKEAEKL